MNTTGPRADLHNELLSMLKTAAEGARKKQKADPAYKEDHIRIYREKGIKWPPDTTLVSAAIHELSHQMCERQFQIVFLGEMIESPASTGFMDINVSCRRLVDHGPSLYKKKVPTLLETSQIYVRELAEKCDGLHHMAFQGWDITMYNKAGLKDLSSSNLKDMAGNMFNAFFFVALILAMIVAIPKILAEQSMDDDTSSGVIIEEAIHASMGDNSSESHAKDSESEEAYSDNLVAASDNETIDSSSD